VLELAALLAPLYAQPGDPFTNPAVMAKYVEAVQSVAATPEMGALAGGSGTGFGKGGNSPPISLRPVLGSGDHPLDLEYTSILTHDDKGVSLGQYARRMEYGVGPLSLHQPGGLAGGH